MCVYALVHLLADYLQPSHDYMLAASDFSTLLLVSVLVMVVAFIYACVGPVSALVTVLLFICLFTLLYPFPRLPKHGPGLVVVALYYNYQHHFNTCYCFFFVALFCP